MSSLTESDKSSSALEDRLTLDPVTGLRNEYLFRLRLHDEYARARENETNAALLAIKLDKIEDINHRYGRSAGDDALRALRNIFLKVQSDVGHESHMLFKLAGPIFGYYLPACSSGQAQALAEDIVKRVSTTELFIERLTVSVGSVNLYEFFQRDEEPAKIAQLIERAALRRIAKAVRNGGNSAYTASDSQDYAENEKKRVLIVDPDQAAMALVERSLNAAGLEVETCRNGETAFSLIQTKPPSVVICEAMTPRLNGFMLRDRLQANSESRAIPFILVSHKKTEETITRAVELDIRHYFQKPISITEITGLVTNILRGNPA